MRRPLVVGERFVEEGSIKKIPRKLLFFVVAILPLLFLFSIEQFLRLRKKVYIGEARYIQLREYNPFATYIGYTPRGEAVSIRADGDGFIMPSKIHERADLTIVFLGGSTTECAKVDEEVRFPYLTGRILEKKTLLKVNSYNSGFSRNNSLNSLNILLNKVFPLCPDIVIMMHNINDVATLVRYNSYWNNKGPIRKASARSLFLAGITKLFQRAVPNLMFEYRILGNDWGIPEATKRCNVRMSHIDKEHCAKEFEKNLRTFISICKARDIVLVLMTQESRLDDPLDAEGRRYFGKFSNRISFEDMKELINVFNNIVREVGQKNNVRVIDLERKIPKAKDYLSDYIHFTNLGSRLAAEIISEELIPLVASMKYEELSGR